MTAIQFKIVMLAEIWLLFMITSLTYIQVVQAVAYIPQVKEIGVLYNGTTN